MDVGSAAFPKHDGGRMLMRETPEMIVFTYLKHIESEDDDNEAIVRVICKDGKEHPGPPQGGKPIFGVYGIVKVDEASYLLYIKEARVIGRLHNSRVWEVVRGGVSPLSQRVDKSMLERLNALADMFFKLPGLLFSDFSLSTAGIDVGAIGEQAERRESEGPYENSDFIFNYIPYSKFVHTYPELQLFGMKTVQGFFGKVPLHTIPGEGVEARSYSLISRRSWRNAGTRYHSRGADRNGHAANTVETVHVVEEGEKTDKTFLQLRGSIPLPWEQRINLSYKPPVTLGPREEAMATLEQHLRILHGRYGKKVLFVNLLDEEGHEAELNAFFRSEMERAGVSAINLDYHRMMKSESKRDAFHRDLARALEDESLVVRTNCIDCLDRTNVVQFQIAKTRLFEQLAEREGTSEDLEGLLREDSLKKLSQLWNDNANTLSFQYTGTSALKNDIAQYGVRTFGGMIKDAISSGKRYVNNNFTDGKMQETIEIVTGVRNALGNSCRGGGIVSLHLAVFLVCLLGFARAYLRTTKGGRHTKLDIAFYTLCMATLVLAVLFRRSFLSFPSPRHTKPM